MFCGETDAVQYAFYHSRVCQNWADPMVYPFVVNFFSSLAFPLLQLKYTSQTRLIFCRVCVLLLRMELLAAALQSRSNSPKVGSGTRGALHLLVA